MNSMYVDDFVSLFRGRGDVYGHEEGRCVKEPLNIARFQDHLYGREAIGVYPMVPLGNDYACVWGCSDIDIEDINLAITLHQTLKAAGVTSWIERSRSKGYHVWVFVSDLVPAVDMRRMLLLAHQVCEIPAREVNPKQETLSHGQYGNYVRLPYFNGGNETPTKRVILDPNTLEPMPLARFLSGAFPTKNSPALIKQLAQMYVPPAPLRQINITDPSGSVEEVLRLVGPLARVIWRDGPLEGKDRSFTLVKLCGLLQRGGISPSDAKIILEDADRRWGKYHLRANGGQEIEKIIQKVYS